MAQFKYDPDIANERVKQMQEITAPVIIGFGDLEAVAAAVDEWPDSYEVEVTKVVASSELAELDIVYKTHGANKTDITRRLDKIGVRYVVAKTKTKRLDG